ncbi:MAG: peptidoglycan editing factor PgeF [Gammaproteobacteria bacterium]|nr:peptidoglycan editing factor PgeF [Gammaproteobacteria bacterium]
MLPADGFITPEWPVAASVKAVMTTRCGGVSLPPYNSFNLGDHVGDRAQDVAQNRELLAQRLALEGEVQWLSQQHTARVVRLGAGESSTGEVADGCYSDVAGVVCAVMTADCLPVLICDQQGREVAALHAGWRGLHAGVLEAGVAAFTAPPEQLIVWLGAAIGPAAFEVGGEVREAFIVRDAAAVAAFSAAPTAGKWFADIYLLARQRLEKLGVRAIFGGGECTYSQPQRFFSYRRDGVTGRMASLIWLAPDHL